MSPQSVDLLTPQHMSFLPRLAWGLITANAVLRILTFVFSRWDVKPVWCFSSTSSWPTSSGCWSRVCTSTRCSSLSSLRTDTSWSISLSAGVGERRRPSSCTYARSTNLQRKARPSPFVGPFSPLHQRFFLTWQSSKVTSVMTVWGFFPFFSNNKPNKTK